MTWDTSLPDPLRTRLRALLDDPRLPRSAAAFDADGTLWSGDVGELVLQAMIGLGKVPASYWARYEALLPVDAPAACALCVEAFRGSRLDEVRAWSRELVASQQHGPLFAPVVGLARALAERGCEVWVVSGSNAWTVREGVEAVGLDPARVLALTGPHPEGVFTGEVSRPVTCAAGKVEALRRATDRPLLLAAGNALYDVALLEHAELPLTIAPRGQPTRLRELAHARGWPVLDV